MPNFQHTKPMFEFIQITPEIIRLHSVGIEAVLSHTEKKMAKDALLPAEFVAGFADAAASRSPWLGLWICDRATGIVIGSGMYKGEPNGDGVEIGYGISPEWERKGAASALVAQLVAFATDNGVIRVYAHTLPDNVASQRVLEKNEFSLIGPVHHAEDGDVLLFARITHS